MSKISGLLNNRANNFNLLRLIFALMVLYSHSYTLLNKDHLEPLNALLRTPLSLIGVSGFFIISGFLITGSFIRNNQKHNLFRYFLARFLRIYPGLVTLIVSLVFIFGPFLSSWETIDYFNHLSLNFLINNILLIQKVQYELPGVFADNYTNVVCGSLWTLPYELYLYLLAPMVILAFQRHPYRLVLLLISINLILIYLNPTIRGMSVLELFILDYIIYLGNCFFIGTIFYLYQDKIYLNLQWLIIALGSLVSLSLLFSTNDFRNFLINFCFAYCIFFLARFPKDFLAWGQKIGDYSYGIYIWSFPIQQIIIDQTKVNSPEILLFLSLIATTPLAMASWHLIEKKCIDLVKPCSEFIKKK